MGLKIQRREIKVNEKDSFILSREIYNLSAKVFAHKLDAVIAVSEFGKNEISVAPSARLVLLMDGFVHFVDQAVQLRDQMLEQEKNSSQKSKNTKDSDLSASEKKDTDSVH